MTHSQINPTKVGGFNVKTKIQTFPENFKKEIGFCYFEKDIIFAIEYFKEIVRQQDLSLRKDILKKIGGKSNGKKM